MAPPDLHLTANFTTNTLQVANLLRNSYFCRLPKIWNSLPPIDLNQLFTSIRSFIIGTFWDHFTANFDSDNPCTCHFTCLRMSQLLL